jgi:hypothetical protein
MIHTVVGHTNGSASIDRRKMGLSDSLKKFDAQSSVSKEFRVHTAKGAVISIVTVIGKSVLAEST